MSDKLQSASDAMSVLPDITVLTLSGRDCIAFAQAQFMSDLAALVDGQWQWSGWLTPKGRVVALLVVIRRSAERLDLLVLDADVATLATSLGRFVFRSKVTLDFRSDLQVAGRLGAPVVARGAHISESAEIVELDFGTDADARTLSLLPLHPEVELNPHVLGRWRTFDLAHGLPRLEDDQRAQWTPQQLSLDRLRAFSVSKGCYPGQEIVARTHFLGQVKRGLVALQGRLDLGAGTDVTSGDQALGRVVCSEGELMLAVLPLDRLDAPLAVAGNDVAVRPLLDGLAR